MVEQRVLVCMTLFLSIFPFSMGQILLNCQNNFHLKNLADFDINVELLPLSDYGLHPSQPYVYDSKGNNKTLPRLFASSNSKEFCSYTMSHYFVSGEGGICQTLRTSNSWQVNANRRVIFDFKINGNISLIRAIHGNQWNIMTQSLSLKSPLIPLERDIIVPLRMPLDDIFNHISFQAVPMIGTVFSLYPKDWKMLRFHCSELTATLLNLLGVDDNDLVIEKPVYAKKVLLPWIPNWLPLISPSMFGIARNASNMWTANLIAKKFERSVLKQLQPLELHSPSHPTASAKMLQSPTDPYRYIVYGSRAGQDTRDVYKEQELLHMISKVINKSKYRLVVIGNTTSYSGRELTQASWQRFAKVYSKAIVMMGPHGSNFNNVMFTPSDCHSIEFNFLPQRNYKPQQDQRTFALSAHFAMGNTGKFFNIEPVREFTLKEDMFHSRYMKISQRDVLNTLMLINKDIPNHDLLIDNIDIMDVPELSEVDLAWKYIPSTPIKGKKHRSDKDKVVNAVNPKARKRTSFRRNQRID